MQPSRRVAAYLDSPAFMALGRFGAMFLVLLGTPLVARALGPTGRGVTSAVLAVSVLLPVVLSLGVPLASRRRVLETREADVVRTGRRWAAVTAIPTVVLAILIEPVLFSDLSGGERIAYYASMASVPMTVSWAVDANVLVATRCFRKTGLLSVIQAAVSTAVIFGFWLSQSLDVEAVLYANLAGVVTTFAMGRYWVKGTGGRVSNLRGTIGEGAGLAGGEAADVSAKKLDQAIALPLLGSAAAGTYSVAVTMGALAAPVTQAFANAAFGKLMSEDRVATIRVVRHGAALSLMTASTLAIVSWLAIPSVFGEQFRDSRTVALVTIGGSVFSGVSYVCAMALAAARRGREMTFAQVSGLVASVLLIVPGAAAWGAVGVAASMAAGAMVSMTISLWRLQVAPVAALPRPHDFVGAIRAVTRL